MQELFRRAPYLPYLAAVALVLFLGLGGYVVTQGLSPAGQGEGDATTPQPGAADVSDEEQEAPDFALEQLNGEAFRLSDHRGEIVAINFWATWCPPCREEIPDFIELQEEMEEDVLFVGVSLDEGGPEEVRAFAEEFGINYPIVIDDGTVVEKYGPIAGIPTTFLVDQGGYVRLQAMGQLTEEKLRPVLQALAEGEELDEVGPPFRNVDRPLGTKP